MGVVTGEFTGLAGGMVIGVVEGTVTGVASGLAGVIVKGVEDGTVTIVGVGLSSGIVTGLVGKVVGASNTPCIVVFKWGLFSSSLLEEGNNCSSSRFGSSWLNCSISDTSAYNPAILPIISVLLSKDFEILSVSAATSIPLGTAGLLTVNTMGTSLRGRTALAWVALLIIA